MWKKSERGNGSAHVQQAKPVPNKGRLDAYRKLILDAIAFRNGEPVLNGSPAHADVVFTEMFRNARHEMRILSGNLNPDAYGSNNVRGALSGFLDREGKVKIVLEDDSDMDNHPLKDLLRRCEIHPLDPDIKDQVDYHMVVMDEIGYRFEQDSQECKAIVAFGDDERSQKLIRVFDRIWEYSVEADAKKSGV